MPVHVTPFAHGGQEDSRTVLVPTGGEGTPLLLTVNSSRQEYDLSMVAGHSGLQASSLAVPLAVKASVGTAWCSVDIQKRAPVPTGSFDASTGRVLEQSETWVVGFGGATPEGVCDTLIAIHTATGRVLTCKRKSVDTAAPPAVVGSPLAGASTSVGPAPPVTWPDARKYATLTPVPKAVIPEDVSDVKEGKGKSASAVSKSKEVAKPAAIAVTGKDKLGARLASAGGSQTPVASNESTTIGYTPVPLVLYGGIDATGTIRDDCFVFTFDPSQLAAAFSISPVGASLGAVATPSPHLPTAAMLNPTSPRKAVAVSASTDTLLAHTPKATADAAAVLAAPKPLFVRVGPRPDVAGPGPRAFHAAASSHSRVYVSGGMGTSLRSPGKRLLQVDACMLGDMWALDCSTWSWAPIYSNGLQPPPRVLHQLVCVAGSDDAHRSGAAYDVRAIIPAYDKISSPTAGESSSSTLPGVSHTTAAPEFLISVGGICERSVTAPGAVTAAAEASSVSGIHGAGTVGDEGSVIRTTPATVPGASRPTSANLIRPGSSGGTSPRTDATAGDRPITTSTLFDGGVYVLVLDEKLAAYTDTESMGVSNSKDDALSSATARQGSSQAITPRSAAGKAVGGPSGSAASKSSSSTNTAKASSVKGKEGKGEAVDPKKPNSTWIRLPWFDLSSASESALTPRGEPWFAEEDHPLLRRYSHTACVTVVSADGVGSDDEVVGGQHKPKLTLWVAGGISESLLSALEKRSEGPKGAAKATLRAAPYLQIEFNSAEAGGNEGLGAPATQLKTQSLDSAAVDAYGARLLKRGGGVESSLSIVEQHYPDGEYEGATHGGARSGHGAMRYTSGTEYEGHWKDDAWDGEGELRYPDGRIYRGTLVQGQFQGAGRMAWPRPEGGTPLLAPGIVYGSGSAPTALSARVSVSDTGSWKHLQAPGSRIVVGEWPVASCTGQWDANLPSGQCILTYHNGCTFEGELRGGHIQGEGTLTGVDAVEGTSLSVRGHWESGVLHGPQCTVVCTEGTNTETYVGAVAQGVRHGSGKLWLPDGTYFEGQFYNGRRNGPGRIRLPDKSVYEGKFVGDKRAGFGTLIYPNGDMYQGSWRDDTMDGAGVLRRKDGSETRGLWSHGDMASALVA